MLGEGAEPQGILLHLPKEVEDGNGDTTVGQTAHHNEGLPVEVDSLRGDTQRVLIDGNSVRIVEQLQIRRVNFTQISADHEGGTHDGPKGHVGAVFAVGHPTVANLQHVRIVPGAGALVALPEEVDEAGTDHGGPVVLDVRGSAPHVSDGGFPGEHREFGLTVDGVHDGTTGLLQCSSHLGVCGLLFLTVFVSVAPVVLQEVVAPLGEDVSILLFVPQ